MNLNEEFSTQLDEIIKTKVAEALANTYNLDKKRADEVKQGLHEANDEIQYIDIDKGDKTTQYAETKERVKAFRRVFPEGSISTKLVEWDKENGNIIMKAEVFNENGSLLASGYACENINVGFINKGGNALENCETSCINRALGFLGLGIKGGFASVENMQQVAQMKEVEDGLHLCRRCRRKITDAVDKKGNVIKSDVIAHETLKVYGDTYCLSCAAAIKNAKVEVLSE